MFCRNKIKYTRQLQRLNSYDNREEEKGKAIMLPDFALHSKVLVNIMAINKQNRINSHQPLNGNKQYKNYFLLLSGQSWLIFVGKSGTTVEVIYTNGGNGVGPLSARNNSIMNNFANHSV